MNRDQARETNDNYFREVEADLVNHPPHYTAGTIETIDYIKDNLTAKEFQGYCIGNVIKYLSRHRYKNGIEDLEKAQVYLGWAIDSMKGEPLQK